MRKIFLSLILYTTFSHAQFLEKAQKEVTEFRTYPRIQKAEELISQDHLSQAKALLEKAIDIDPANQKANNMLIRICLEQDNTKCAKSYLRLLPANDLKKYFETYIAYKDKNYSKASQLAEKISIDTLSPEYQTSLKNIRLFSALYGNDHQLIDKAVKKYYTNTKNLCSKQGVDIISTLLEKGYMTYLYPYMKRYNRICPNTPKKIEKSIIWSEFLRDHQEKAKALELAKLLPKNKKRELLIASISVNSQNKSEAIEALENLYAEDKNKTIFKRLAYLYSKTNAHMKLKKLYLDRYSSHPDPKLMEEILYLDKEPSLQTLQRFFPFIGLSEKKRFTLATTLIDKYIENGDIKKATEFLHQLQSWQKLSIKKQFYISNTYLKMGKVDTAIKMMEKLYEQYPVKPIQKKLLYLYASKKNHQTDKAEKLLTETLSDKCDRDALLSLLNLSRISNKGFKRLEVLKPFACLTPPKRLYAYEKLARHYQQKKKGKKALNLYKEMIRLTSDHKALENIGYQLKKLGDINSFINIQKRLLVLDSKHHNALVHLANYYYLHKKYQKAKYYYQKLYQLYPKQLRYTKILGEIALKENNNDEVLRYWYPYVQHYSSSAIALQYVSVLIERKKFKEASSRLSNMNSIPKKKKGFFYQLKGKIAENGNKIDEAIHYYQQALLNLPRSKQYLMLTYETALLHAKNNDHPEAIKLLESIVDSLPFVYRAKAWSQIGYWAQKMENHKKAVKAFQKALDVRKSHKIYEALALSQSKLYNHKKAAENYKKAFNIYKNEKYVDPVKLYSLKRSIQFMQKEFSGYFAMLTSNMNQNSSPYVINEENGGFAAFKLNYNPHIFNGKVNFFISASSAIEAKSIHLLKKSIQPSIGVSYQPFNDTVVLISVEQLVKGGEESRNDTMMRLSGTFFDDYRYDPEHNNVWFQRMYLDLAWFFEHNTYRFYAKYEFGKRFYQNSYGAWLPYLTTLVEADNDNEKQKENHNIDIGAGLSYLFWLNEGENTPHRFTGRAGVEARHSIGGNYSKNDTVQLMLEVLF